MKRVVCIFLFFLIYLNFSKTIHAVTQQHQSTVTASVLGTKVTVTGFTAPFNSVEFYNELTGKSIGIFKADSEGIFRFTMPLKFITAQTLCLRASDADGNQTKPNCFLVSTTKKTLSFTRIILPPSFKLTIADKHKNVEISGFTLKNSDVTLYLDGSSVATIKANEKGFFSYKMPIQNFSVHNILTKAQRDDLATPNSNTQYFRLLPAILSFTRDLSRYITQPQLIISKAKKFSDLWLLLIILLELLIICRQIHHRKYLALAKRKKHRKKIVPFNQSYPL